jgi:hypothetical protein
MNSATIVSSQTCEVNHISSWEGAMNFLFEGQLEKKTRERSTENVMGEPEPGAGSRITARSPWEIKGTCEALHDSVSALITIYACVQIFQ